MEEQQPDKKNSGINAFLVFVFEATIIIFFLYSILLIREYTHSGIGQNKGIIYALQDMFTLTNSAIAISTAIIGAFVVEFIRRKL